MRDFCQLSGPWAGFSVQHLFRINETIQLRIDQTSIIGTGTDYDGHFEVSGDYDIKTQKVTLTRRYTWTTEVSQEGVGVAYHYDGHWNGVMVSGQWYQRSDPKNCGEFEMWPNSDDDRKLLMIDLRELSTRA